MKINARFLAASAAMCLFSQNVLAQCDGARETGDASRSLRQCEAGQGVGGATAGEAPVSRPFLQGTWEGVLTAVGLEGDPVPAAYPEFPDDPGRKLGFKLDIDQTNLVFSLLNGDTWIPIGQGADLRLNDRGRSSIVIAALPGPTENTLEVWLLNITRWEEDQMLVHVSRTTGADAAAGLAPQGLNLMGLLDRAG